MSPATAADLLLLLAALALPAAIVVRWGWRGIVPAGLAHWLILVAAGRVLSALDPAREAGLIDSIWLLLGWIAGLAYASAVFLLDRLARLAARRARPRRHTAPQ